MQKEQTEKASNLPKKLGKMDGRTGIGRDSKQTNITQSYIE